MTAGAASPTAPPRRFAPLRLIVARERHGNREDGRLECGHVYSRPYTGFQVFRRCECCRTEAPRG